MFGFFLWLRQQDVNHPANVYSTRGQRKKHLPILGRHFGPSWCQVPKKCPETHSLVHQVSCLFLDWWFMSTPDPCALNTMWNTHRGRALTKHLLVFLLKAAPLILIFESQLKGNCRNLEGGEGALLCFAVLCPVHRLKNQACTSLTLMTICLPARKEIRLSVSWAHKSSPFPLYSVLVEKSEKQEAVKPPRRGWQRKKSTWHREGWLH